MRSNDSEERNKILNDEMELLLSNNFKDKFKGDLGINNRYVNLWIMTIALGMFQFGFSMSIMNQFTVTLWDFFKEDEWGKSYKQFFNSLSTVAVPFGALIGSNLGGYLVRIGSRKALLIVNLIFIVNIPIMLTFKELVLL